MSLFRPRNLLALATVTAFGLAVGAGVASAHVTVNPDSAVAGSYTKLTFRVPNESAKADTVKLTVNFPMDHPFAAVSIKKQPGWTALATTTKLSTPISDDDNASITQAVSSITWTADASGQIALGQFAEFDVSVGPVPRVTSLAFDAIQTYSDGSVVKWDEPIPASGVEPDHPAPVLTITPAGEITTAPAAASGSAPVPTVTAQAAPVASTISEDNPARVLGVVGILVGALGLLTATVALRRRPRVKP